MKRKHLHLRLWVTMALTMFVSVARLHAGENDYLESFSHYHVTSMGNGVLRFNIPVWVWGNKGQHDYYLRCSDACNQANDTYIWYSLDGSSENKRCISFGGHEKDINNNNGNKGRGYIWVHPNCGNIIIRNTYDAVPVTVTDHDGGNWTEVYLKRKSDAEWNPITYIEFDWYLPTSLQDEKFFVGIKADVWKKDGGRYDTYNWQWSDKFEGGKTPQSPELYDPYLHTVNENGTAGYGYAAIPYVTYQEPLWYYTSLNGKKQSCTSQSGTLYVPTTDKVQSGFYATFNIYPDKQGNPNTQQELSTNKVSIPAYHKLYDLKAEEQRDKQKSMTGTTVVSWEVKTPKEQDLVEGDFFEIQRSLMSDFSGAQSIAVVPYSSDTSTYHYADDITALKNPTDTGTYTSFTKYYDIYKDGEVIARYKGTVTSLRQKAGTPVYYRVRRASSSVWDWENNPYALKTSLLKNEFLAPLDTMQPEYELDKNFADNRIVHFNIKIANKVVKPDPTPAADCKYDLQLEEYDLSSVPVRLIRRADVLADAPDTVFINYMLKDTSVWELASDTIMTLQDSIFSFDVPYDATVRFRAKVTHVTEPVEIAASGPIYGYVKTNTYVAGATPVTVTKLSPVVDENAYYIARDEFDKSFRRDSLDKYKADLYANLSPMLKRDDADTISRCQWDKNAQILITKHMTDMGLTQTIYVPQDSIVRQADGSWIAHVTDVADAGCTHYEYEVRIDPSHSLLNFNDEKYQKSIALKGPDLYTADAANISSFTATQGTDKKGVALQWEPTPGGVTDYVLARRSHGTNDAFEELLVTEEPGYLDADTDPNKHYDYQLTLRFTCNGNYTEISDTIEGWRSPYGSIAGRVQFEDGSGCAGINVEIASDKDTIKVITKADGSYLADSLLYDATGTDYSITPTSDYGTFSYNNTSAQSATISISKGRSEAASITFVNTSSVRLTGRVLYQGTTIPVYGANFRINGKLVSYAGAPVSTAHDGTFQLTMPERAPVTLQVVMDGHTFANDGYLRIDGKDTVSLTKAQDGVRFWDMTTVRLTGRVVGGNDQGKLPLGFGLSYNNLGEDLKIVMALEGDNISYMVNDPQDPTITERDTAFAHLVHTPNGIDTVGNTTMKIMQKRLIVNPDPVTGEYEIDLWPVRYKISQVTAKGYATLYGDGQGIETIDLTGAVLTDQEVTRDYDTVHYNAIYNRIYHSPIALKLIQRGLNGECDYFGIKEMKATDVADEQTNVEIPIVSKDTVGNITYLFGHPVFSKGNYNFRAEAYEEYYYNNDKLTGKRDQVNMHGGTLRIHNGLHDNNQTIIRQLDANGKAEFGVAVDDPVFHLKGEAALHTISASVEIENDYVEADPIQAFITGARMEEKSIRADTVGIAIVDILRDPPGEGSYAWLESGSKYHYGHTINLQVKAGVEIGFGFGANITNNIGTYAGTPVAGVYAGTDYTVSKQFKFSIPIAMEYNGKWTYSYDIQTNNKISTSSSKVGSDADVFIGKMQGLLYGERKVIRAITEQTYNLRKPAVDAGTLVVLGSGIMDSKKYYLVIGTETVIGSALTGKFAYTQEYIINTLLPNLVKERNSLLLSGTKSEIQTLANATGKILYWDKTTEQNKDSFGLPNHYEQIKPANYSGSPTDKVSVLNKMILQWVDVLTLNEKQKVEAKANGRNVGTWSVSGGTSQTYSENFSYTYSYDWELGGLLGGSSSELFKGMAGIGTEIGNNIANLIDKVYDKSNGSTFPWEINGKAPGANWKVTFKPILNADVSGPYGNSDSHTKTIGFTLTPNKFGNLTTSVYCTTDSAFEAESAKHRDKADVPNSKPTYGSFVFFTQAGASMCPYEAEERTKFYNPGTLLNNGTVKIEEPRLEIDAHERSNVPADKAAIFNLRISNEGQTDNSVGSTFSLTQNASSNPNGAKIFIDGMPVTGNGMDFFIMSGQSVTKVMEVYRGTTDDYENIELRLGSTTCAKNADNLKFSVHFLPSSSDVKISAPHDKWVMNTFAAQDSVGYYLPITIEGFDINHRGFDHIEFQYKLTTQSDDDWVNQCSFYADKNLYDAASGNKEMITNGRINTLRFYGERDPMEQQYDLRAVSFCRHGSGFVSKSSPVLTGIKDTRPPRVFGVAEPANAILSVGDNLKLRFNEPIAGNYLDEDNNFQLLGTTNNTGITSSTSVHFDGTEESYAKSKVERNLADKSFSIDMVVRPSSTTGNEIFFTHGKLGEGLMFGKTADNRLVLQSGTNTPYYSKPLPNPMMAFTRLVVTYNKENGEIRFYVGTLDVTDDNSDSFSYAHSAPLCFGSGFAGNMLEARVWTKALNTEEIAATNMVRLTGYEQQLAAYYPMNEGKGETLTDKANGATLYTHGATWTTPSGISLAYKGTEEVELDQDILSRGKTQDYTLMFWFKTTSTDATIFSAGRYEATDSTTARGTWIGMKNGKLLFRNDGKDVNSGNSLADDSWHHYVLSVNRTMNTASIFVDSKMLNQFACDNLSPLSGMMYLGADGFTGNIDEFVMYELALPKSFIETYDNIAPHGDEMGLIAYLSFEERKESTSGVMENVFSVNNRRIVKDSQGNIIKKVQPLVLKPADVASMADKNNDAPVRERSQLTKLNFDWAFNHDELLINLNMLDREINKQSIYVTVRNVEDLNGNRMVSPVMWQAFVDRNSLKWDMRELKLHAYYGDMEATNAQKVVISNHSGIRHQFTIESNAEWLSVDMPYGSIDPTDDKTITFTYNTELPVGVYSELVYLTDENGLSEPLRVELVIEAICPWEDEEVDESFANTMSLRGQVYIEKEKGNGYFDSDENDMVAVFCDGKLVGKSNNTFASSTNKSYVYLTIHGNDKMRNKVLSFKLWQASTGRVYNLQPDTVQRFVPNAMRGISPQTPVLLTTSAGSLQQINLNSGWNWVSWFLQPNNSMLNALYTAEQGFHNGDMIKSPASARHSEFKYNDSEAKWCGGITSMDYRSIYMLYVSQPLTLNIEGRTLNDAQRTLTLKKEWNCVPYLLDEPVNMRDALADYYDKASVGDIIKSRTQFSVFTENHKWEGSLQTMHPGQGYLLRRLDSAMVKMRYNKPTANNAPRRHALSAAQSTDLGFSNPRAASNMTMIVAIQDSATLTDLRVYVGDELAGLTGSININNKQFYFVTVQSDKMGDLRFEMNGETLYPIGGSIAYEADAHVGSLKAPVMLTFQDIDNQVYKLIEDNHVVIIRGGEKYDVIGHKLTK